MQLPERKEKILPKQDKQLSELSHLRNLHWLIMKTTHHLHKPLLLRRTEYLHPSSSKELVLKFVLLVTIETLSMIHI